MCNITQWPISDGQVNKGGQGNKGGLWRVVWLSCDAHHLIGPGGGGDYFEVIRHYAVATEQLMCPECIIQLHLGVYLGRSRISQCI